MSVFCLNANIYKVKSLSVLVSVSKVVIPFHTEHFFIPLKVFSLAA